MRQFWTLHVWSKTILPGSGVNCSQYLINAAWACAVSNVVSSNYFFSPESLCAHVQEQWNGLWKSVLFHCLFGRVSLVCHQFEINENEIKSRGEWCPVLFERPLFSPGQKLVKVFLVFCNEIQVNDKRFFTRRTELSMTSAHVQKLYLNLYLAMYTFPLLPVPNAFYKNKFDGCIEFSYNQNSETYYLNCNSESSIYTELKWNIAVTGGLHSLWWNYWKGFSKFLYGQSHRS